MTTIAIETVRGPLASGSLALLGWKHGSIESAQQAAQQAAEDGYSRIVIQTVGAKRLQEGRSMDEDDHWVAAPGVEHFVWVDRATHDVKQAEIMKGINERDAIAKQTRQDAYDTLLAQFNDMPHPHFIMTGTRFFEAMGSAGHSELSQAAAASGNLEKLRQVVMDRNSRR